MNHPLFRTALRGLEHLLFLLLAAMVVIVFTNVVARFGFDSALTWADEVARFLFIWLTFIGATVGLARGAHIGMDIVVQMVSPAVKRWMGVVSDALVLLFLACWGLFGWQLVLQNLDYLAPATGLPMGYVYAVAPLSALVMAIVALLSLTRGLSQAYTFEEK